MPQTPREARRSFLQLAVRSILARYALAADWQLSATWFSVIYFATPQAIRAPPPPKGTG